MNAEVKAGYKLTELGLMPGDWSLGCLGNICDVRDGTHDSPKLLKKGVPFVTSKNIVDGKLDLNDVSYISEEDAAEINKRSKVDENDIIMAMIGTIGTAARIDVEPNFCIKNVALLKPKSINSQFIFQLICSPLYQAYINDNLDGGIQKFVSLGTLRSLHVPMPDMYEQCAIATVLSDMDDLISGLDQIIAKKRDIKQAAMQQLLTGQTRLPGFSGEWEVKRLGELCRITTGKKDVNEGNPNGQFPFFTCARNPTFSDDYSFDCEAILIAGNGEVGNLNYYSGKFEAYQRTYVLMNFSLSASYIWHQLSAHLADALGIGKIGSSIPYIKKGDLLGFELKHPTSVEEQAAIVNALSDMDDELATLETRRNKCMTLKQGMMQELLTGRIRLLENT